MNQKSILIAVAALIVGVLASGTVAAYAVNGDHQNIKNLYAMHGSKTNPSTMGTSMHDAASGLAGKTGEAFDKAFLSDMIEHHQGAIDMANLALTNAKHQEVKDLATNIITSQSKELTQMKSWQSEWGYETHSATMGDHDMMHM